MEAPEARAPAPPRAPLAGLEVEGPSRDSDLPFVVLGTWPDEAEEPFESLPRSFDQGAAESAGPWQGALAAAGRAWEAARPGVRRAQRHGLAVLQLVTCNLLAYFHEHLSPRNVLLLLMSALVFSTAWLALDPSSCGWAVGLLYLLTSTSRIGAIEPLWTAAAAILVQCLFDVCPAVGRRILWYLLACLAAVLELSWWPSVEFLIEADFHSWLVHFSTYYIVVIEFWFWPQLLQIDPARWHITEEIQKAPAETQEAILDAGVGLAILVLLPLLACSLMAGVLIWRRSPQICFIIGVVYAALVALVLCYRDITPEEVVSVGQVPIAAIFIILAREQLASVFGDTWTWKGLSVFLLCMIVLRHVAMHLTAPQDMDKLQAAAVILFQLFSKHWLAAQCSAVRQGLTSCLSRAAWLPRRTALLFGHEEAFDPRLTLGR